MILGVAKNIRIHLKARKHLKPTLLNLKSYSAVNFELSFLAKATNVKTGGFPGADGNILASHTYRPLISVSNSLFTVLPIAAVPPRCAPRALVTNMDLGLTPA